jgi:hypothetical protein
LNPLVYLVPHLLQISGQFNQGFQQIFFLQRDDESRVQLSKRNFIISSQAEDTVLDRIEIRKLRWFGHLMRMSEERWPAKIHSWIPPVRRKRGRPRRHGGMALQRKWNKGGWVQKTPRTGYFGGEDWEGSGPLHKPIYIYIYII